MEPAERLREHIVGVPVLLKSGMTLIIAPAKRTPREVLSPNNLSDDNGYGELAERLRDEFMAHKRSGKPLSDDWDLFVVKAIQNSYDITIEELIEAKWLDQDGTDAIKIAKVSWGFGVMTKARRRALALSLAGVADIPLTVHESAMLADWLWNSKAAPTMPEG